MKVTISGVTDGDCADCDALFNGDYIPLSEMEEEDCYGPPTGYPEELYVEGDAACEACYGLLSDTFYCDSLYYVEMMYVCIFFNRTKGKRALYFYLNTFDDELNESILEGLCSENSNTPYDCTAINQALTVTGSIAGCSGTISVTVSHAA